jgi:hypothetical protein
MNRLPPTGEYRIRVQILPRTLAAQGANGEKAESWPASGAAYSAARDALSGGEQLAQGIAASTGFQKLRIQGRAIAVKAVDRLLIVATGELYNVVGVEREFVDTVISVDRVAQQSTGQ